jgi:hypothetical protein
MSLKIPFYLLDALDEIVLRAFSMASAITKQFRSRLLVAALLIASGLLWAVMFFGPLAHLRHLAGGLTPFDIRPRGYSFAETKAGIKNPELA